MPTSTIVGRLRAIEGDTFFILGGNLRIYLSPGVPVPAFPLGTSLTVVAVSLHDVLYAESIVQTPPESL
jgi:hypothetical protein